MTATTFQSADPTARIAQLRIAKRAATTLLGLVSLIFVALVLLTDDQPWAVYALAAAEGAMVGGLADWFAVTALFRHPLGLPIPHTAVIRERKDQFGATLGSFVQENFLGPDVLAERVRASGLGARTGAWLAEPANATAVSGAVTDLLVAVADVFRDEDVHRIVDEELHRAVASVQVAPLAGRVLRLATAEDRHQEVLDAFLRGLEKFIVENEDELRTRLGRESPWWLPGAAQDRIFERLVEGVHELVASINADPNHEMRQLFDERVALLIDRLEHDPAMQEKGEQVTADLLGHPELRAWSSGLWAEAKATLRAQATDPDSPLRRRVADGVVTVGGRLSGDPVLRAKMEDLAETAACYVAEHYQEEIAEMISGTISRWDGEETSDKLELLLGRDLQFIRVNGTVVGGLAGVAIHAMAQVLG